MPELPDIEAYLHALRPRLVGDSLRRLTLRSPFVLRSVEPGPEAIEGLSVRGLRRLGKRVVIELDAGSDAPLFVVIHLMVAGRLAWKGPDAAMGRIDLAGFRFGGGTLTLTEAGAKHRASIHLVRGEADLRRHDPGGLELLEPDATPVALRAALQRENRTLKRALTDPRTVSGVGNAYADEILLHARLSPILLTSRLTPGEAERLLASARQVLHSWQATLCARVDKKFPGPGEVTAFRPEFAAHGRFGKPCPRCGPPPVAIQRIVHAESETNYCPRCQTGGRVLADRSLSRLLKDHWPRTIDELDEPS